MENDSDYLMISGLKHFKFCRRRWALVHIEQLWNENALTLDGHFMHERVHDSNFTESRGSVLLSRGMPVRSEKLKITGVCDMVELHKDAHGIPIYGREGKWSVYPIEYKHGKPDPKEADEIQLCAQAMCLEEMFVTDIPVGAIYYGGLHARKTIELNEELRNEVEKCIGEMYQYFTRGYTPRVKASKACKNCSMYELCQPNLSKRESAREYINRMIFED